MYLFDKLCGLSLLCVFAKLFFEKKKGMQANKGDMLNVYHFTWVHGQSECNCIPERTKGCFPEIFF